MAILSNQQLIGLKADILADPILDAEPNNSDGAFAIAIAYNLLAVPDFTVWKSRISIDEIGDAIDGSELESLTTAETNRLQVLAQYAMAGGIEPSRLDRRAFFDQIFSAAGGQITRPALLALYKRLANRLEKLFSTGTGSDAAPAVLVVEGTVSFQQVLVARSLP